MQEKSLGELLGKIAGRARVVLRASREDADMSQEKLAKVLGWTRHMVANLEGGRRECRFVDFVAIAWALKVEPERMLRRILGW